MRRIQDISISITTGWTVAGQFPVGQEIFLYFTFSRPALEPNQPSIRWVPRGYSGRDVKLKTHLHLAPRLKMGSYTSAPTICTHIIMLN
jgi:hypothetical protein